MKIIIRLTAILGTAAAATALFAVPAGAAPPGPAAWQGHHGAQRSTGVVFVQNDAPGGNTIIAYRRTGDGALAQAGSYPTGGDGGVLSGSVVDHLASQGSLAYDRAGHLLIAVNAGSDTITGFTVRGDRLVRRQVLPSGGDFPVSIAVHGHLVYVLNARDGGSISGFLELGGRLLPIPAWHRELSLNTSAPGELDEFTSTPAQIGFTPDGRELLVATKNGAGGTSNSVEAFRVGPFGPSHRPVVTSLPGTVPFGFTFDRLGDLVLTEAGPNAVASFAVRRDGTLVQRDWIATGQVATCWIVAAGGHLYASNAASGTISRYGVSRSGRLIDEGTTSTDAGTVDAAVSGDGRYLYVQAGAAGVVDAFRIGRDGSLTPSGSVTVPDASGGEGIVAL